MRPLTEKEIQNIDSKRTAERDLFDLQMDLELLMTKYQASIKIDEISEGEISLLISLDPQANDNGVTTRSEILKNVYEIEGS